MIEPKIVEHVVQSFFHKMFEGLSHS